jgi:transcription initiation factor TFIIB
MIRKVSEMIMSNSSGVDITSYVSQLELSSKTQKRAESILVDAEKAGLTSRKAPESLVAAALYIAGILEGERRTQEKIGQVTGVSPQTIQTRYKELVHELKIRSG